jgi:hypothetical protein
MPNFFGGADSWFCLAIRCILISECSFRPARPPTVADPRCRLKSGSGNGNPLHSLYLAITLRVCQNSAFLIRRANPVLRNILEAWSCRFGKREYHNSWNGPRFLSAGFCLRYGWAAG